MKTRKTAPVKPLKISQLKTRAWKMNPWNMAVLEFKRYRGVPVIALIFILTVPLLYGGIYLDANWDLYSHIDKVKVAIVNEDKPVEFEGTTINAGQRFLETIKGQEGFYWQLPKSAAEADRKLKQGEYYMVVIVPQNFSANLVAAGQFRPERATIIFHRDDANGFIAGSLLSQLQAVIKEQVNTSVGQAYFSTLFGQLSVIRDGFEQAADGSRQLALGLNEAADGVTQINSAVTGLNLDGAKKDLGELSKAMNLVDYGATQILTGMAGASGTVTGLSGFADSLDAGKESVDAALAPLRNYVKNVLPKIKETSEQLGSVTDSLIGAAGGGLIGQNQQALDAALASLAEVKQNPQLLRDPTYLAKLSSNLNDLIKVQQEIKPIISQQAGLNASLLANLGYTAAESALDAADAVLKTLDSTRSSLSVSLRNFATYSTQIENGIKSIQSGKEQINRIASSLDGTLPAAVTGVINLVNALARLDQAMSMLDSGAQKLADGLEGGLAQIPALRQSDIDKLAEIMSSPVATEVVVDNDAQAYGRGLAPFFFSIALWVTTVTFFLVMRTMSGRVILSRGSTIRTAIHGLSPFALMSVASSLLMGLGVWGWLGLNPVHPWYFVLLLVVAALSFTTLSYWVRLWLGSPQSAVFLILLIFQLPASGGTFPTAMLSPLYSGLSVISPMRYSVDAFRVAISGGTHLQYWGSVSVLLGLLAVSLVMTYVMVRRRRIMRMRDLHPPMITSESTGDYAFSVRPR